MSRGETEQCQHLLPYLIDDLSSDYRRDFEKHLKDCSKCRDELEELQPVWDSLPLFMEEIDPPAELKEQVFSSLFPDEPAPPSYSSHKSNRWKERLSTSWGKVAVVLLFLLMGVTWNNMQLRGQLSALQEEMSFPVQVVKSYTMVAADPSMKEASGSVWILQNGERKKLVVHMNGLASTQGEQAYQVWIVHNGQRQNAGTFRVDEKGRGILTYHFSDPNMQFESIGITLEPDPYGDQPRGKKVSGTI
jgi:hypothetical protein